MVDFQYPIWDFFKEEVLSYVGIRESTLLEASEMQNDNPRVSIKGKAGVWVSQTQGVRFWFETTDDTKVSRFIRAISSGASYASLLLHESGKNLLVNRVQLFPWQLDYGDHASLVLEGNVLNEYVSGLKSVSFLLTIWSAPEEYSKLAPSTTLNVDGWIYEIAEIDQAHSSEFDESNCLIISRANGETFTSTEVTKELALFQKFLDIAFVGMSCCPLGIGIDGESETIWAFNQSPILGELLDLDSPTTPPLSHFWNKNSDIETIYSNFRRNMSDEAGSAFLLHALTRYLNIRHILGFAHENRVYDFFIPALDSAAALLEGTSKLVLNRESPSTVRVPVKRMIHQAYEASGSSFPIIDSEMLGLPNKCLIDYLVAVRNDSVHMNFDFLANRGRAALELVDLSLLGCVDN